MKRRITNLLIATTWLLITAVWIPTFWTLTELPGTLDGTKASALLLYAEDDIETVDYTVSDSHCRKKFGDKKDYNWLFCDPELRTTTGTSFVPLIVFTLLILGAQYLLTGKVTLRLTRKAEESS